MWRSTLGACLEGRPRVAVHEPCVRAVAAAQAQRNGYDFDMIVLAYLVAVSSCFTIVPPVHGLVLKPARTGRIDLDAAAVASARMGLSLGPFSGFF